jgi:hypothetical protein
VVVKRIAAAALVAALAVSIPVASAAPEKVKSKITMKVELPFKATVKRGSTLFHGKVKADRDACVPGRPVTLYREPEGGGAKQEVGTTETDANGKWEVIVLAFSPGDYYAQVAKTEAGNKICLGAKSNVYHREI